MTPDTAIPSEAQPRAFQPGPRGADAYRWFEQRAEALLRPLVALMREGESTLPIRGRTSSHGEEADRLEAFARPALLAALWLQAEPDPDPAPDALSRDEVAAWIREAIRLGTDPDSGRYWGNLTNYHQHAVEMAIFTMALDYADDWIWNPLDQATRDAAASWMGQIRGHAGHANNHWFFDVLTVEFLRTRGHAEPGDGALIAYMLDELERMHRAGGWFIDGCNETYDHYNAFAFHTYGLHWARRFGERDPERRARWLELADAFVPSYANLFAASGEHVPVGRSLTYRFNASSVFPLAAATGVGGLEPGVLRRLSRLNIDFFDADRAAQDDGCLSVGWLDHFEPVAEPYSCAGSPYWASKAFMMLTLPPEHAFFSEPEAPIPAEQGDGEHTDDAPGWVVRHRDGAVELLSAGARCSPGSAERFGAWKWGRLSYRTGVDYVVPRTGEAYPADASLTARAPGGERWYGRRTSVPLAVDTDGLSCLYALGSADESFHVNVRTDLRWLGDWLLAVHRVRCWQPTVLRHGGYALPVPSDNSPESTAGPGSLRASAAGRTSTLQVLGAPACEFSLDTQAEPRRHIAAPGHALPQAIFGTDDDPIVGERTLIVLWGAFADPAHATPWQLTDERSENRADLVLEHETLGVWRIDGIHNPGPHEPSV